MMGTVRKKEGNKTAKAIISKTDKVALNFSCIGRNHIHDMMLRSIAASNITRRIILPTAKRSIVANCNSVIPGSSSLLHINISATSTSFTASKTCSSVVDIRRRWYTPMTPEEQEKEKARITHLTPEEKDQELRELNRQIALLEMKRGINTGELYTWSGRYKVLMRDYAMPLFLYYWSVWSTMGVGVYLAIGVGGLDAMEVIAWFDSVSGFSLAEKVDPTLGTIGLTLVLNEALEPIRLPFVVATLKPLMDVISPPKF